VMHPKVLISVVLSRRLLMVVSALVSMAQVITSFIRVLCILILLLKLIYLFLQIMSRK